VVNKIKRLLRKVKAPQLLVGLLLSLSFLTGCASTTPQQNPYMLTGAGLGAAMGAALGIAASPNNAWKGAAIGGLLGTAVGGVAGEAYGRSVTPQPSYGPPPPPQGYYYQQPGPQPQGYSYAPPNPNYN
jgi:hypothetical protein